MTVRAMAVAIAMTGITMLQRVYIFRDRKGKSFSPLLLNVYN
jgi:hypothetical protein